MEQVVFKQADLSDTDGVTGGGQDHLLKLLSCSPAAKPTLLLRPENVSVRLGESAQFYCRAKGDPPPAVVWSREQGPLPNGR